MLFDVGATPAGAVGTLGGAASAPLGTGAAGQEGGADPAIIAVKLRMAQMCWSLAAAVLGTVWPRQRRMASRCWDVETKAVVMVTCRTDVESISGVRGPGRSCRWPIKDEGFCPQWRQGRSVEIKSPI